MAEDITILMVDDDAEDAFMVEKAVSTVTFADFQHFTNGYDLFNYLGLFDRDRETIDLGSRVIILLDINMPQQDGYEVLQLIRLNPRLSHLPVIILTAMDLDESVYPSYKIGANAYVRKPGTPDEMKRFVRAFADFWLDLARIPPAPGAFTTRRQ